MQDAIIKGNGNSRYLKTVAAALSLYPTYEDMLQAMIAGTFPIDLNGINADGWTQQGTPLNKGNLLSDTVEKAIWNNLSNRTVNDALSVLGDVGNVHVWKRDTIYEEDVPAGYTLGASQILYLYQGNAPGSSGFVVRYGNITVDSAGNIAWDGDPTEVSGTYYNQTSLDGVIQGRFITISAESHAKFYYIPANATISAGGWYYVRLSAAQSVTGYPETPAGTVTDYPTSTDRNAFGEGYQDYQPAGYTLGSATKIYLTSQGTANMSEGVKYNSDISVDSSGNISMPTYQYAQIAHSGASYDDEIKGKFVETKVFTVVGQTAIGIYYIPSDATIQRVYDSAYTQYRTYVDTAQPVIGYPETGSAYLTYLGALGDKARIEVGSYVGTGTYGASNPNRLTFSASPNLVIILAGNIAIDSMIVTPNTSVNSVEYGGSFATQNFSWSKSAVEWYASSAHFQLNETEKVYEVITFY